LWPKGRYGYWKSSFLTEFSDGAIDTILKFYAKTPSPGTVIVVEHDGDGAWSRVPENATAFGHRSWSYNIVVTTMWDSAADTDVNIHWTREFWEAMRPFLADATYVNYLGEVEEEDVRAAYGKKYERLAALKAKYDPTNFFFHLLLPIGLSRRTPFPPPALPGFIGTTGLPPPHTAQPGSHEVLVDRTRDHR
jgi:FAD/FMN-containing dehydrogenase